MVAVELMEYYESMNLNITAEFLKIIQNTLLTWNNQIQIDKILKQDELISEFTSKDQGITSEPETSSQL